MAITYKISVPKPCAENWNEMTPTEKGRYCSVCATNVIDFSVMTDQEIIDFYETNKEKFCGNYSENQLNRVLDVPTQKPARNKLALHLAASLIPTSIAQPLIAQSDKPPSLSLRKNVDDNEFEKIAPTPIPITKTIQGTVVDKNTGKPIVNATVYISSKPSTSTHTDENGNFEIDVTFYTTTYKLNMHIADSTDKKYRYFNTITLASSEQPLLISLIEINSNVRSIGVGVGERIVKPKKTWWQFWK